MRNDCAGVEDGSLDPPVHIPSCIHVPSIGRLAIPLLNRKYKKQSRKCHPTDDSRQFNSTRLRRRPVRHLPRPSRQEISDQLWSRFLSEMSRPMVPDQIGMPDLQAPVRRLLQRNPTTVRQQLLLIATIRTRESPSHFHRDVAGCAVAGRHHRMDRLLRRWMDHVENSELRRVVPNGHPFSGVQDDSQFARGSPADRSLALKMFWG